MEARYVCDRCKKETTSFLKMQTVHVGISGILVNGSYLLCDKCADDFTDSFIGGYQPESDEVKEEHEDASTEKLPAVYWDLGDGRLLKVPASIVQASIHLGNVKKQKGGDNDAKL